MIEVLGYDCFSLVEFLGKMVNCVIRFFVEIRLYFFFNKLIKWYLKEFNRFSNYIIVFFFKNNFDGVKREEKLYRVEVGKEVDK